MEIPAFFATYRDQRMMVTDGRFSAVSPKPGNEFLPFGETVSKVVDKSHRSPALFVDCDSFQMHEFSEKVMKHMKAPGMDVWFMTYVDSVEDVFDAFNKDADLVFAPYHFIRSEAELRDICSVSDSFVPVISVHRGRAITGSRSSSDVLKVLEKLVSIGFYRNSVMDAGNSLDGYTWSVIAEDYPSTIPIVDRTGGIEGFQSTIIPYPV